MKRIGLILILLTATLASAYHVPDGYAHGSQWGPTIMPISPPEDTPHVSLESCRERLVDVVRQARAYLGNSRPYLEVGPVEREIRVVGRDRLLSEMDMLLRECR